jgi:hypothetical protein
MTQCQCANPPGGVVTCAPHQTAVCRVTNGVIDARCIDTPNMLAESLRQGITRHRLDELRGNKEFQLFVKNLLDLDFHHLDYDELQNAVNIVLRALFNPRDVVHENVAYEVNFSENESRHSLSYKNTKIKFTVPHYQDADPELVPDDFFTVDQ